MATSIAMPKNIATSYSPKYRQIDLGVVGAAALQGLAGGGDMNNLANTIKDAANAALPEFTSSAGAQLLSGLAQTAGLQGGLDANSLQALNRGRIFNPFKEQIFTGIDFRTHTFDFKMVARSLPEAKEIKSIINYFKFGSVPNIGGTEDSLDFGDAEGLDVSAAEKAFEGLAGNRFFTTPDTFDIKFVRMETNSDGNTIVSKDQDFMHFKIHPSVCTNISVNYTPDGQYTSFKTLDGKAIQVPALTLNVQFAEMKLITKKDIKQGY
jgi:hypothetical protein